TSGLPVEVKKKKPRAALVTIPVWRPVLSLRVFRTSVYFGDCSQPYFLELSTGNDLSIPTRSPFVGVNPPCSNVSASALILFGIGNFGTLRVNSGFFNFAPTTAPFRVQ